MDKNYFWNIVDDARETDGFANTAPNLTRMLTRMEVPDIITFNNIFWEYMKLSHRSRLRAAAFVLNSGCCDEGFDCFRSWLIAMGKSTYMNALQNPDCLGNLVLAQNAEYGDMLYTALHAYFHKTGQTDFRAFHSETERFSLSADMRKAIAEEIQFAEDMDAAWNETSVQLLVPKLFALYGEH